MLGPARSFHTALCFVLVRGRGNLKRSQQACRLEMAAAHEPRESAPARARSTRTGPDWMRSPNGWDHLPSCGEPPRVGAWPRGARWEGEGGRKVDREDEEPGEESGETTGRAAPPQKAELGSRLPKSERPLHGSHGPCSGLHRQEARPPAARVPRAHTGILLPAEPHDPRISGLKLRGCAPHKSYNVTALQRNCTTAVAKGAPRAPQGEMRHRLPLSAASARHWTGTGSMMNFSGSALGPVRTSTRGVRAALLWATTLPFNEASARVPQGGADAPRCL
ncbi:unnamed protein product [Prorocentrum cordatum]|uniref:Uncharacterized protein n=1 Tax=Prorocentrum cordatum TaxID=2364126 RepID=A0ABN9QSF9_9DINO|nr:unnamed protein product [Polarella glacialis]